MRKLIVAALAAGAIGVGVVVAPAAAEPAPPSCHGGVVATSVQPSALGPGRRAVASNVGFGEDPTAVRDANQFLKAFCAG
jgi:hypothetical protein